MTPAVAPAGYSGTPLPRKLGIKPGHRVALLHEPPQFRGVLGELPDDLIVTTRLAGRPFDVIVFFTREAARLRRRLPALARRIQPAGAVWVAWPKRASKVPTDVTEDVVRAIALPLGMVDVKVCAVDETWSGLRLVIRVENRPGRT